MKFVEFEKKIHSKKRQSASYIRKKFFVVKEVRSAVVNMTALGVYIPYCNGERLDNQVLLPGYTDYNHRVQYQFYDITPLLRQGDNLLAAVVGDGWYRGSVGIGSKTNCYGKKTKFGCEMTITYIDGSTEVLCADATWKVSQNGALRENDLKIREFYDATKECSNWNQLGFDDSDWQNAIPASYDGAVIPQEGEKLLEHEHFSPTVLNTPNGETVLDFGQNMAGYVSFHIRHGIAGHRVTLTMGETLDERGNFTTKNFSAEGASLISGEVGQELLYICKEGSQSYKPHFLVSGFRFVKLGDWCEPVYAENFEAIAVYSDIPFVGDFKCSNEKINQLVKNIRWSQKSNFIDIPCDCPTRERAGWTGDINVFCEAACYLSDPRKFLKKWLRDYMLEQGKDGSLPYVVPEGGYSKRQRSCCGWSDAISNISMILYWFYGDTEYLSFVYDSVKRFVEFQRKRAMKKNPLTCTKNSNHRKYIIESGFHYGEWLEPNRPMYRDFIQDLFYPDTEFTTAWFYRTTKQLSDMAAILGKEEDAQIYATLASNISKAYCAEFLRDGNVQSNRQCRYVRPLFMGLSENQLIAYELNKMVSANHYKIGTGFHTTHKILSVLCDYGYTDTAYRMLENESCPGWLYEVCKGATTMWENWNGIGNNGKPTDSLNHYAPGAVVAWLFSYCAGIRPLKPGFEEIQIRPYAGGTLTKVVCSYKSVQGRISVQWQKKDGVFTLSVDTPSKTTVILPDGNCQIISAGTYQFNCEVL